MKQLVGVFKFSIPIKLVLKNNKVFLRLCHTKSAKLIENAQCIHEPRKNKIIDKITFNSVLHRDLITLSWFRRRKLKKNAIEESKKAAFKKLVTPVCLKYYDSKNLHEENEKLCGDELGVSDIVNFPYAHNYPYDKNNEPVLINQEENCYSTGILENSKVKMGSWNWMSDYEYFDDSYTDSQFPINNSLEINYGRPDPTIPVSNAPCGGCGALLHCQNTSIPGYLPSELFLQCDSTELKTIICQRCHFIKNYNTFLNVSVHPDDYAMLISTIKEKHATVILIIDLMDFPCSIWPNILEIIGVKRPVVVVGNKVDLLPQDCPGFLNHVKECLISSLEKTGLSSANIKHVALISAQTGFGVEELITKLHNFWNYTGDIYMIGCTNVGKSTLFNSLLHSDFCKVKAMDIVQRATVSPWPGTTLNLLKFPILRPSDLRKFLRTQRLLSERREAAAENQLRNLQLKASKNIETATLVGNVGRTFYDNKENFTTDPFSMGRSTRVTNIGLDHKDPAFQNSRWCFDTPGTVQPDQVINILTTEELMLTLPKKLLIPRTFCVTPQSTLFIAGIGRLDYVHGEKSVRLTVFSAETLPVTICSTSDAFDVYETLLGSDMFAVPCGSPDRLATWPPLKVHETDFEIEGENWRKSCADIVFSSAGWVAITPGRGLKCIFKAWTPEGRGIYFRQPALLQYSVNHRGDRVKRTPAYLLGKAVKICN